MSQGRLKSKIMIMAAVKSTNKKKYSVEEKEEEEDKVKMMLKKVQKNIMITMRITMQEKRK